MGENTPGINAHRAAAIDSNEKSRPSTIARHLVGRFRWVICAVLFVGISKNYMDRQLFHSIFDFGFAYLVAFGIVHVLVPRLEPIR